jgi:Predicted nucleic acid-binding protein, contains PIN domain
MILVDANVWREAAHQKGDARVRSWLKEHDPRLRLSSIVLAEMRYGVEKMEDGKRRNALIQWCENLEMAFADRLLSFDCANSRSYGRIANQMRLLGLNIGQSDCMIAAQALDNGMTIATRNVQDFARTGVALLNPWDT